MSVAVGGEGRAQERERLTSSFSDCTERHPGHKKRVKKKKYRRTTSTQ